MRLKTIYKEIDAVVEALLHGDPKKKQKAVKKLVELRNRIQFELQKEEEKQKEKNPQALSLAKWYYGIWDGKIPEGNFGRVVKTFRELLEAFKLPEEEIKELYTWWLNLDKNEVPKRFWRIYGIVLGERETRSITDFKGKLRYIKGLKKELEGSATPEWGETHGDELYKFLFGSEEGGL